MLQHDMHVSGLAQNAHIGQHTMIDKVVRTTPVAAVFLAFEFSPLRLFDLTSNGGDNDVALQSNSGALQRLHGMRVADERALHVVNTEPVDEAVFYDSMRLVAD